MFIRLWLLLRRPYSWLINQFYRSDRKPLPVPFDFESVKEALSMVKWTVDTFGDWTQQPEVTWGLKRGDCEDQAELAKALLRSIWIHARVLSVFLKPNRYSHAVCVFSQTWETYYEGNVHCERTVYKIFSNGKLDDRNYNSIDEIVQKIAGKNKVLYYKLEK
jgi:hypothetical protein